MEGKQQKAAMGGGDNRGDEEAATQKGAKMSHGPFWLKEAKTLRLGFVFPSPARPEW